jgi:branched-subunit amino acid permease
MKMSTEEVEVRVWAVIALSLTGILVASVIGIILGVLFVEHDMDRISPIDTQFMAILKDIMLLCIGAVGGIVGRKGAYAAANMIAKDKDDSARPTA